MIRRYGQSVDGSIPIQALLYPDEELLATQEGVGIYDGLQKSPDHQAGYVYATSHRLFYVDSQNELDNSFTIDLAQVTQTDYYSGLFTSSSKVTLHLSQSMETQLPVNAFESWECQVCAFKNAPGLSPAAAKICGLCGVPRDAMPNTLSTSLPASPSPVSLQSQRTRKLTSIACPACTFLNHPSLRACEMCSTELELPPVHAKSVPSSRPESPDPDDSHSNNARLIKLSFRKGGDKPFYAVLKRALKSKAWEGDRPNLRDSSSAMNNNRSGISGILDTVETSAQGRQSNMHGALQDLEAFMIKAKEMVRVAAELNERLTLATATAQKTKDVLGHSAGATVAEPEEATFIRSSLSQLGLQMTNTPVTLDMMKDERKWINELSRELGNVLQGSSGAGDGLMRQRGVVALDEVWGGWNRARGVALIPPATLLQVLPHVPTYTDPPINLRTFKSGLSVLHTPPYSQSAFAYRVSSLLGTSGPRTTTEITQHEDITIGLASEMIQAVEDEGIISRDDSACVITATGGAYSEIRWWSNIFSTYEWDGQE